MYCKYVTASGAGAAGVLADIALLCSGTALGSLSGTHCDIAQSTQTNTVAPGWTVYDNDAGSSAQVLSCSDYDAKTTKYFKLEISGSNYLNLTPYETWNAGANTGTNGNTGITNSLLVSAGAGNVHHIFCTPRMIVIFTQYTVTTYLSGGLEVTREAHYLKGASTYPAHFGVHVSALDASGSGVSTYFSRYKNLTSAGDTTGASATALKLGTIRSDVNATGSTYLRQYNSTIQGLSGAIYHEVMPYHVVFAPSADSTIYVGRVYGMYITTSATGATGDTLTVGSDTYVVCRCTSLRTFAFKVE
jgi:hypothetical protein